MKVVVCIKVFNEEDFIKECIDSIYPFCDKIIIIDSCFAGMEKIIREDRIGPNGGSGDRTLEIIKSLPDPDSKIDLREHGYIHGDQTIVYNEFVQSVDVGDFIWMIDADEVYSPGVANKIRNFLDNNTHAIWMPSKIYWHDFTHVRSLTGEGWTRPHQRIYMKLAPSAYYSKRNLIVQWLDDNDNKYAYGIPPKTTHYRGKEYNVIIGTLADNDLWYHHYAYVKSDQRILEKLLCQYYQNEAPLQDTEWRHCKQFHDAIEFKIMTHSWFTNLDSADIEKVSRGSHPKMMQKNLWYNYRWNQKRSTIDYETASRLTGETNV